MLSLPIKSALFGKDITSCPVHVAALRSETQTQRDLLVVLSAGPVDI